LKTHQKGGASCDEDSVGGTPTDAVETTALPKKSLMIGVEMGLRTKFFMSSVWRRCRAAKIQGRAAALPYLGGEDNL
jgi:hypothetical protein